MNRPMRLMAQRTVFADRCMLKQQRPAELLVTAQAQFIGRIPRKLAAGYGRMRAVTVTADHLVKPNRMRRRLQAVGLLLLMVGSAFFSARFGSAFF